MTPRVEDQLAQLDRAGPAELRYQWRQIYRSTAPDMPPDLMRRAIAWRLQERIHGGLSPVVMKGIGALQAKLARADGNSLPAAPALKPGTKLVREWHGRTCIVLVGDEGFLFEQRHYRSLTQIAREITGVAWSGPRFFGLNARSRKASDAKA